MEQERLNAILIEHEKYLVHSEDGAKANLMDANLSGAYLGGADLRYSDLSGADMTGADLCHANLRGADMTGANLMDANLSGADLSDADLRDANLSGAEGLINPSDWMRDNFDSDSEGYIVYKAFGDTDYTPPARWTIEPGAIIEETVNSLQTVSCGCGVNFATRLWIKVNYGNNNIVVWKCRIHWQDLLTVVVPYNTDGKARCGRLELLEQVQ